MSARTETLGGEEYYHLNKETIALFHSIGRNEVINKAKSKKIKAQLEKAGIIEANALHEDVERNGLLTKTMALHLANGLSTTVEGSFYGTPYISDHFLYFNCSTDAKLHEFLKSQKIVLSHEEFVALAKRRNNLY